MLRVLRLCLPLVLVPALAPPARAWPDTFVGRLEVLALMQTLNATLLGARSATFALETWCGDHAMAPEPRIRARLARDVRKEATPEQRARLKVDANEPLMFRHVELACGTKILSEADNWYVPARLTPEMNRLLESDRHALRPRRSGPQAGPPDV